MDALLRLLLDPSLVPPATDSLATWWDATAAHRAIWSTPVERALAGGACADRLGFAFAGGYAEALRALVPAISGITALCATEDGGAHPRAIQTRLAPAVAGGFTLTGRKRWATIATSASSLLVVASTGLAPDGTNRLRAVRVAAGAPGVTMTPASAPFVPEIPHAAVAFDAVAIAADDVLPGDGYTDYLKPFRTIEDLHVHAALVGYLIGVARRHHLPRDLLERLLAAALATHAAATADPRAATTHLALAGLLDGVRALAAELEQRWAAAPDDEHARWLRDRSLLGVAGTARTARRDRAWAVIAGEPEPD